MELLRPSHAEDNVEDAELPGGESANHHAPGAQARGAQLHEAGLLRDVDQAGGHAPIATSAGLVDLGQQGVRWGEMMAAATPAITPDPSDTDTLPAELIVLGVWPMPE